MTGETNAEWDLVQEIIADALECPADEQMAFAAQAAGDNVAVLEQVERLLLIAGEASTFLGAPASFIPDDLPDPDGESDPDADLAREVIGQYRLKQRIATGGAGTVYEAEQDRPSRTVALKLLRADVSSPALVRRFEREAEVLAHVQHPGIAHVYEAGVHERGIHRQPFIAMELVPEARSIVAYANAMDCDIDARLRLFLDACDAIAHGHDRGIVHRDLKPSNILVDGTAHVKVIDYGVARVLSSGEEEQTIETRAGDIIGTLPYMSPEQCGGDPEDVGPQADVYGLGVVLFELLAGRLPLLLGGMSLTDATQAIRTHPPARLKRLVPAASPDLDAITSKAIEKDTSHRYKSVGALADDIRRHLALRPIVAHPPTMFRQMSLFARRHRAVVSAAIAIGLTLLGAAIVSGVFAVRASHNASVARSERDTVNAILDKLRSVLLSPDPHQQGESVTVLEMLDEMVSDLDAAENEMPEVDATVRHMIGETYLGLGKTDAAIAQLTRAAELFTDVNPIQCADCWNKVGLTHQLKRDHALAEASFRRALAIVQSSPPDEVVRRDNVAGNLATSLWKQEKFAEAKPLARELLQARIERHGAASVPVISSLRQISEIHAELDELDEAEKVQRRALETARDTVEESHPILAAVVGELAMIIDKSGRLEESLSYHREGWRLAREYRRPGTSDWQIRLHYTAEAFARTGDHETAIAILDEGISQLTEHRGPEDRQVQGLIRRRAGLIQEN